MAHWQTRIQMRLGIQRPVCSLIYGLKLKLVLPECKHSRIDEFAQTPSEQWHYDLCWQQPTLSALQTALLDMLHFATTWANIHLPGDAGRHLSITTCNAPSSSGSANASCLAMRWKPPNPETSMAQLTRHTAHIYISSFLLPAVWHYSQIPNRACFCSTSCKWMNKHKKSQYWYQYYNEETCGYSHFHPSARLWNFLEAGHPGTLQPRLYSLSVLMLVAIARTPTGPSLQADRMKTHRD